MTNGDCPYSDGWKSGLAKNARWPPCALHIVVGDISAHHTKCGCNTCKPGSEHLLTGQDVWGDDVEDPRADYIAAYN